MFRIAAYEMELNIRIFHLEVSHCFGDWAHRGHLGAAQPYVTADDTFFLYQFIFCLIQEVNSFLSAAS
jgi:hypothetical protein